MVREGGAGGSRGQLAGPPELGPPVRVGGRVHHQPAGVRAHPDGVALERVLQGVVSPRGGVGHPSVQPGDELDGADPLRGELNCAKVLEASLWRGGINGRI